jgi:large subunit ribosomal protein L25
MKEEVVLEGKAREVIGKQVRALRRQGLLPAVIYGRKVEPLTISLDSKEASHVLSGVSSSQLITVVVDGKNHVALVRERQRHPVTGAFLHIDFQEVSMTEKLRTTVTVELRGESPAVKNFDAVIVTGQEKLEIECLPKDLPERFIVDISVLKEIGNAVYVRDIAIPADVQVLTDLNELIVLATAPAAAEVEEAPEVVEVAPLEPEVIERGKKEEEEEF